jgi:hypothetical protein
MSKQVQSPSVLARLGRVDAIAGLTIMLIAAAIWRQAAKLAPGVIANFGPGMLPQILVVILFAAGTVLLLMGLAKSAAPGDTLRLAWRGPVLIFAAILVFALCVRGVAWGGISLPQLGLAVAGPLTVLIAGHARPRASWRNLAALGFGLTALCMVLFGDMFGMQIPIVPEFIETAMPASLDPVWILRTVALVYAALTAAIVYIVPAMPPARHV